MTGRHDPTVDRLVAAAARRFADEGWRNARLDGVLADAGERDHSLISYHFGSREGILLEIVVRAVDAMEERREAELAELARSGREPDVTELVELVVRPLADLLHDHHQRDFLRLLVQLGPLFEMSTGIRSGPVAGTALERGVVLLSDRLAELLGPDTARERLRGLVVMATAMLSVRAGEVSGWLAAVGGVDAEDVDAAARVHGRAGHEDFVTDLCRQLAAAATC